MSGSPAGVCIAGGSCYCRGQRHKAGSLGRSISCAWRAQRKHFCHHSMESTPARGRRGRGRGITRSKCTHCAMEPGSSKAQLPACSDRN